MRSSVSLSLVPRCGSVPVLPLGIPVKPAVAERALLSRHCSPRLPLPASAGDLSK